MNEIQWKLWNMEDKKALDDATDFKQLVNIALAIISRMTGDAHMVSGPISTGGVGTVEGNGKVFANIIEILIKDQGINIFSQMPFEEKMVKLYKEWFKNNPNEKYCRPILDDFYEPLFSSGKVKVLHFIHNWESSTSARWENENCERWGIEKKYLSKELLIKALYFR